MTEDSITVTGRIRIKNGNMSHLPVLTSKKVSPSEGKRILEEISKLQVEAPVKNGDCIVKNIGGSGADLLAARSIRQRLSTGEFS